VKTTAGEIMAKELKRETARTIELRSVNPAYSDRTIARDEVSWMARILWASQ
jgi:phage repressor protein C with HTH and peptisase S24 domain